jgi:hypothetical protein
VPAIRASLRELADQLTAFLAGLFLIAPAPQADHVRRPPSTKCSRRHATLLDLAESAELYAKTLPVQVITKDRARQ